MGFVLRALLWLAPREFRGRYGGELLDFYQERLRDHRPGTSARVLFDLILTIAIEWGRVLGTIASPNDHQRTLTSGERMSVLGQEVMHAGRSLRKNAGFTAAAVLTLALGLASTTAIFSIVDSVLLKPLPFAESDRIVLPESGTLGTTVTGSSIPYADFMDWRDNHVFEAVAAFTENDMDLTGSADPIRVKVVPATPQFFAALGVKPARGRLLDKNDYPITAARAVVISDRLWHTKFGGREDIIGTEIELNSVKRPIVGVLPRGARWPLTSDIWVPLRLVSETGEDQTRRDNMIYQAIARLKPDATLQSTRAQMGMLAARVAKEQPNIRGRTTMVPTPIMQGLLGNTTPRVLWILLGAVGLLLLIACVNVANLQLARATAQQREMSVRTALGASRYRLIRQTLAESALLGLAGGAVGLVGAQWLVKALVAAAPAGVPRIETAQLNLTAVSFATAISVLVALLFGLVPALQASRSDPSQAMAGGNRAGSSRSTNRTRRALVVAELALSVVLLAGAGLALRSIQHLNSVQTGFDTPSVLTASVSLPRIRYRTNQDVIQFFNTLRERLVVAPGIRAAGIVTAGPLNSGGFYLGRSMAPEGKAPTQENETSVNWSVATPGYFAALGVPIRGRDFAITDDSASTPVMIVSETFAKRMFQTTDVLGKRAESTRDEKVYRQIIGVVPDVKFYGMRDSARALVWVPYSQNPWGFGMITVRAQGNPLTVVSTVRRELSSIDRNVAMAGISTMQEAAAQSISSERLVAVLLTAFAVLALMLAAVGIFGVLSYTVMQRTRELGVRMALGAQRRDVLGLVLRETTPLVGIGIGTGVGIGLGVTQLMRAILFEIQPTDPVTFIGVPVVLAIVGLVAALLPARRAARVDPLIALRSD